MRMTPQANDRLRAGNKPSHFAPMAKDTPKAIVIIVAMLGLLAGLLVWANHIRPH
jgi:hypothetical protein